MGDLFHEAINNAVRNIILRHIQENPQHRFLVLTKRPKRAGAIDLGNIPNLWLGVSVEDQKTVDQRIPLLLKVLLHPDAKRVVSYEPALGAIKFGKMQYSGMEIDLTGISISNTTGGDWKWQTRKIDWLIAGCESGAARRPANPDWFRSVRDECVAAEVPFYLKQMEIGSKVVKLPELNGKVWNEKPNI